MNSPTYLRPFALLKEKGEKEKRSKEKMNPCQLEHQILILSPNIDGIRISLVKYLIENIGVELTHTGWKYLPSNNDYFPDTRTVFANGDELLMSSDVVLENEKYKKLYINVKNHREYEAYCLSLVHMFPLMHVIYHRRASLASNDFYGYYHQRGQVFVRYLAKKTVDERFLLNFIRNERQQIAAKYFNRWRRYVLKIKLHLEMLYSPRWGFYKERGEYIHFVNMQKTLPMKTDIMRDPFFVSLD